MARIKETRTDCTQNNWTKGPGKPQARKYWRQILKEMTERHKGRKKERKKESERNRENQNKKMNDENKKKKSNPGQNEAIDKRRRWMPDTFVYVGEIMVENNNNDNIKKNTHTRTHSQQQWKEMIFNEEMWTDGTFFPRAGAGGTDRCRCPNRGLLMTIMRVTSLNQVIGESRERGGNPLVNPPQRQPAPV